MRTRILFLISTILLAGAALLPAQTSTSQQPPPAKGHHMMGGHGKSGDMMEECQAMMDDMKAMDAKLDALVQAMNAAEGSRKVDATAAVVAELVAQRKAMSAMMESMQPMMMEHMKHMQMGMESMEQCPMMQGHKTEEGGHKHD